MNTPRTSALAALMVAVCAGCASIPNTAAPDILARYKRIGVISMTAQVFSRVYGGLFSVEREEIDISSWDVDSKYEEQMASGLTALGGFEAVKGTYSRAEFSRLGYQNHGLRWDALDGSMKEYCEKNQVDAILVTVVAYGDDFAGNSHQRIGGAGFLVSGVNSASYLHLISIVALVDCQTAKPVAERGLASVRDGLPGQILRASPAVAVPKEIARSPLKELTEKQVVAIKTVLVGLPKDSWTPTLRAVFGK